MRLLWHAIPAVLLGSACVAGSDKETTPGKQDTAEPSLDDTGDTEDTGDPDAIHDSDGDGITSEIDCDDSDPDVHPYAEEVCDGKDNNCDGAIDEGLDESWWRDGDGDGYGDPDAETFACAEPSGYTDNADDCDDTDASVTDVCITSLTGDWPTTGQNIYRSGYFPGAVGEAVLTSQWSADLGYALQGVTAADGALYVPWQVYADDLGYMTALSLSSGEVLWDYTIPDIRDNMMPGTVHGGTLYFQEMSHSSSRLWALDTADGSVLWSSPFSAQWYEYPAPLVHEDGIWMGGGYYGGIYGFDQSDGAQRFSLGLAQYDEWTPSWHDGTVLSFVEGVLSAHNPDTGIITWELSLGWDWAGWSMGRQIAVSGDTALVCNNPGLYAIDLVTQAELWSVSGICTGTPASDGETVYAIVSGQARSYDLETGTFDQLFPGDGALYGQPIVTDDALIVSSPNNTYVYSKLDATELDSIPTGGTAILADGLLVLTSGTSLHTWAFVNAR